MSQLRPRLPWWRNRRLLPWLLQALALALLLLLGAWLLGNLVRNLSAAGVLLSWRWLAMPAGFDLSESVLPFRATMAYSRALAAGLLNTLRVIALGIPGATLLGVLVGLASFQRNPLLRLLARSYVELVRNIPLLLQLLFWYFVVFLGLPPGTRPLGLSLELAALLTGLITHSGAFIAEVVRGGIAAVPRGQWEAATALGLRAGTRLRRIVLPQALPVILPGLTNQYISLAKASSLALACGYSDLYAVAETSLNQTGRAVEVVLVLLATYLAIDLAIAALMNGWIRRVRIQER